MERDFLSLGNVKHEVDDDCVGERGLNTKEARQWGKAKLLPNLNFVPAANVQESKAIPDSYQWGSVSAATVFRKSQLGGAFQNATPLLLGGSVPLTNHSSLFHTLNYSADNSRKRMASSGSSPQLTIFYGGTVSVFNNISPDKAQDIMLCARNDLKGETGESSLKKKPVREDERVYRKRNHNAASNAMSMIESFNEGPGSMIPSVPQARKASLARFLEKRKERLMSTMPYKKMLLDLSTGESSGMNYSFTSPA